MRDPRVLFATAEVAPWAKSGGLGDVAAALPPALCAAGADARVLVPGYPRLMAALYEPAVLACLPSLGGAFPPARLLGATDRTGRLNLIVLDCPEYYWREGPPYQDDNGRDWDDNHQRFGFLSRVAALLSCEKSPLAWGPEVLHCHDWPTGLAPAYLAQEDVLTAASVMTVHNLAFQGLFPAATAAALDLPESLLHMDGVEYHGQLSFLKAGLFFADRLSTVSATYAEEIRAEASGCGLDGLLRHRADRLSAITNGIDITAWNPATDSFLPARYDSESLERKRVNKAALQRELGLRVDPEIALFGVVSRLTHQKGLDLLLDCAVELAGMPAQLAVLGRGESALEAAFRELAAIHPGAVASAIAFDERLAHLMEAGADIFVMPSRFEPCGLNQMYSMAYGTPPVVRATGGLSDTVTDASEETLMNGSATGFVFDEAEPRVLLAALQRAAALWRNKIAWGRLQRNGMLQDFSWDRSARRYVDLYRTIARRQSARIVPDVRR